VEHFPFLRYWHSFAPGGGYQKQAAIWKQNAQKMANLPFSAALKLIQDGAMTQPSCLGTWSNKVSSGRYDHGFEQEHIKNAAASAFIAGIDTTVCSLKIFFLAMMLSPNVQSKAQEELDRVIGRNRLPSSADEEELPYIKAVYKETLRWYPSVPLGVAHQTVSDDEYRGLFIPKGSHIIPNAWAMLQDERFYGAQADEFEPERFLKHGSRDPTVAFGFGRRICPGRHFVERTLFLTIASVLHLYRIDRPAYMRDKPELKDYKFTSGLVIQPEAFECSISARFPGAISLIQNADSSKPE